MSDGNWMPPIQNNNPWANAGSSSVTARSVTARTSTQGMRQFLQFSGHNPPEGDRFEGQDLLDSSDGPLPETQTAIELEKRQDNGRKDIGLTILEQPNQDEHSKLVTQIAAAHGDQDNITFKNYKRPPSEQNATIEGLQNCVDEAYSNALNNASDAVDNALSNPDANTRVISMSFGESAGTVSAKLKQVLESSPKAQQVFDEANGLSEDSTPEEREAAINQFVKDRIANSDDVNFAVDRFRNATKLAADNGIMTVMAVDNGTQDDQDTAFVSENVITVGAMDDNNTPDNTKDDKRITLAPSKQRPNQPFILADGTGFTNAKGKTTYGTSYAAPAVAGALQIILQDDPSLDFEGAKQKLAEQSHELSGDDQALVLNAISKDN